METTPDTMVENVSYMAKLLHEYGPSTVILAIFLILFLLMFIIMINENKKAAKKLEDSNEAQMRNMEANLNTRYGNLESSNRQFMQNIMDQNNELVRTLTANQVRHNYNPENIVDISVKLGNALNQPCSKTGKKIDCRRLSVNVFHNGVTSTHGLPFFKMSRVAEYHKRGIPYTPKDSCTNIPVNYFSTVINGLYNKGEYVIKNLQLINKENPIQQLISDPDSLTCIFISIYDSSERIMAFLIAEYDQALDDDFINLYSDDMKNLCRILQPVLEYSNQNGGNTEGNN